MSDKQSFNNVSSGQAMETQVIDFYATMPQDLRALVDEAMAITQVSSDTAAMSIGLIDHTSLEDGAGVPMVGVEPPEKIQALCGQAKGTAQAHTAAVCVYPNHIELAAKALAGSDVKVAVVNNFPHGNADAATAAADAQASVQRGAQEVDTVIDYVQFLNGQEDSVREKLQAVADAVHQSHACLKTILKASVYKRYDDLYKAAVLAIECDADFVKTCTGKKPIQGYGNGEADASTLMSAATVMKAVADHRATHPDVAVKISGGVKTPLECERMRFLVNRILGPDYYQPARFRYGASSLLGNLLNQSAASKNKPEPSSY